MVVASSKVTLSTVNITIHVSGAGATVVVVVVAASVVVVVVARQTELFIVSVAMLIIFRIAFCPYLKLNKV